MWRSHPTWGPLRIVGELRKLGIDVAKSTVEKYRPKVLKPSSPTWRAFLNNHVQDVVACDFFTVPTMTFKVLFVFVVLAHERRRIVHCNITEHPTAQWTAQQIVDAFPWDEAPRYLLRDRDRIYGDHLQQRVKNMGIEAVKIVPRSPWQNHMQSGSSAVSVATCFVLDDQRLKRLLTEYARYYHRFRTHLSLAMDCPEPRAVEPPEAVKVLAVPAIGGLHHHYERQAA